MTAVTTLMSISALLNPQQQNADSNNERQNLDRSTKQLHMDGDTDSTQHQSNGEISPRHNKPPRPKSSSSSFAGGDTTKKKKNQQQSQNSFKEDRRERSESVSSTSSTPISTTISERRRAPRPKYTDEEMYFIWYHRVDLDEDWKDCTEAFNRQFPGQGRSERNTQGIQCKFYRFINAKKCPTVREQRRLNDGEFMARGRSSRERMPRYGVIEWCRVWYPWMKKKHAIAGLHLGPQLTPIEQHHSASSSSKHSDSTDASSDKSMMRAYSRSSISSSLASISSSEVSPEPYTPISYSDEILSEDEMEY